MRLSVIILSRDGGIDPKILNSVKFADEVIVWNAKEHPFTDFADHRNQILKKARGDWVLFVDDDEFVGSELAQEIQETLKNPHCAGYLVPRRDLIFHDLLLHGETGGTSLLRLAKKNAGKFIRPVHEFWQISGTIGTLKNPLYHLKDHFISEFMSRMNQYGSIDAQVLNTENKPFSYLRLLVYPKAKFIFNYFWRLGFLDGYLGLFHAYLMSVQSLTVRIFQWERK